MADKKCVHCGSDKGSLRIGLCSPCYSDLKVRSLYSITVKEQELRRKWDMNLHLELIKDDLEKKNSGKSVTADYFGSE